MIHRDWQCYMAKSHFTESARTDWPALDGSDVARHEAAMLPGFEAQILRLPAPIISNTTEVTSIVDLHFRGKRIRIYPPSLIDRRGEVTGAFRHAWIPEGGTEITRYTKVDDTAVQGLVASAQPIKACHYCEVLRLDIEPGANVHDFVHHLLENVGQYTHQWWLRGRSNPFRGMRHFGAEVNKDFSLRELLRHSGARKIESPWYGAVETQGLQGLEAPLTNGVWLRSCQEAGAEMRGEPGFMSFHDAICYYMSQDDEFSILSLTITLEILCNKQRILDGKNPVDFNELLRSSPLIAHEHKQTIRNLFIDRGHVAHGRKPHILGRHKSATLEQYMLAVTSVVQQFLETLPTGKWPEAAHMDIGKKGRSSPK